MESSLADLANALEKAGVGECRFDLASRQLYSVDASIYQIEPLGVVFPQAQDDLSAIVELAAQYGVPILPRGSGSSLAGQAVGEALVIDCTRHLDNIIEINPEEKTALVEPGLVLNAFNQSVAQHGLQFGPDPASSDRATFGGMLGNNSAGAHSITYGMTADHVLAVDAVLSDGSVTTLGNTTLAEAERLAHQDTRLGAIYKTALNIREHNSEVIQKRWPQTWRRSSGYSLNYLLPWSPSSPLRWDHQSNPYPPISPDSINLALLMVGSEGTLAVFRQAKIRLVSKPQNTILGILAFDSIAEACDAVPALLEHSPSAVELISRSLLHLARAVPAYAHLLWFAHGDPAALLVIEFSGDDSRKLKGLAEKLGKNVVIAETPEQQRQVWAVRKVGLGLLMSRPGDAKPIPFIEDIAVPVEHLGEFVRDMERIMDAHNVRCEYYAHASVGCLHIRPLINLKTVSGVETLRGIAEDSVALILRLGGALSGEHGDGLARSELLENVFGAEIMDLFRELKHSADPQGILNPGKIVDAPPMDENLRYGLSYQPVTWTPVFDYSRKGGFLGAVEMCNGAGVCRKSGGVMCPSFQATNEEMHSTRGRANLLRAMFSGHIISNRVGYDLLFDAFDLCLECKGCKSECPSGVDVAKLKYEFLHQYYQQSRRPLRDYLFANVGLLAKLAAPFAFIANPLLSNSILRRAGERFLGLSSKRDLPAIISSKIQSSERHKSPPQTVETVLFLSDPFTKYFYPEIQNAALQALAAAGCQVQILPVLGSGRTKISKGFLPQAKKHAQKVLDAISSLDPGGELPVIGVEPSEILTLRDEYLDLFPGDERVKGLAERAFMIDEFLIRPGPDDKPRIKRLEIKGEGKQVLFHGHCYQKAQPPAVDNYPSGTDATVAMLESLGFEVTLVEAGCCGMAGSFGYEAAHYDLSMQIGEQSLFPAVRDAGADVTVVATGFSCRSQIKDGAERQALHPVELL